uniref:LysM peptidoglycan-binding domain-containing protein n=1 Tax=Sphaerotilus hippei TaxID=744406 RepID=UPI001FE7370F|nr:LysM domain-containing protein [Sphaerotilus hippei]
MTAAYAFPDYPITADQRGTARQVAQAGVPLSELSPTAPDFHVVKRGDTLWDISRLFLRSPWRWPELWGMNLEQIRNPHLIYPGQRLVLVKSGGRARLEIDRGSSGTVRLSPSVRTETLSPEAITGIPMSLIRPFLTDAVVLDEHELASSPRIVAGREGRQLLGRGETAYVRGDLPALQNWRVFRQPRPLRDPATREILGYEATYVGTAQYQRQGDVVTREAGATEVIPATFNLTTLRQEASIGDRLIPAATGDEPTLMPHAPAPSTQGLVVSVYGDQLTAGQDQVVSINLGRQQGMEPGHVLSLLRGGETVVDRDDPLRTKLRLPDEPNGMLFVFRVFDRVSYGLILHSAGPVRSGDRVTAP